GPRRRRRPGAAACPPRGGPRRPRPRSGRAPPGGPRRPRSRPGRTPPGGLRHRRGRRCSRRRSAGSPGRSCRPLPRGVLGPL
ncbi:MAG: hypothetical protein AVDCRST_MAG36-473, partial [uncultured Nocardioidaceae bacterium]